MYSDVPQTALPTRDPIAVWAAGSRTGCSDEDELPNCVTQSVIMAGGMHFAAASTADSVAAPYCHQTWPVFGRLQGKQQFLMVGLAR